MTLKEMRLNANKTVLDVIKVIGVTDATVYLWETKKMIPRLGNIIKLSELYGVPIEDIVRELADERKPDV